MNNNIWVDFAELNGMTPLDFEKEIITTAQACLAMMLNKEGEDALKITSSQFDGVYELTFKRVVK